MDDHRLLPARAFESYGEYLARSGASAIETARAAGPERVLAELERSGLRGRGGAGFKTATKWRTLFEHPCTTRFVVCNAAEGEPGTFKDRFLLRKNPYATLEGLVIAAHVIGARRAWIGLKSSFTHEIARLAAAVTELRERGHLDGLELTVFPGPTEYLFGEEKALLNAIENGLPLPREAAYPPYELGLFGNAFSPNPALVNNAETFAHVATIVRHGAESFRALGTDDTPGTVLYTLCGDVRRPGVHELPAGTTLRELLFEHAGGPTDGVKALLSGVSNGVLLPAQLDTPADFGALARAGSGLGSAGFIVLGESRSIPRVAQTLVRFLYVESCNQCTACKHGLRIASAALDELHDPERASADDLERARYGAQSAPQGNRCYLPVQASVFLPSLMNAFHAEFAAQLDQPTPEPPPFELPLIVDYDEARAKFTYDPLHATKRPDWTYAQDKTLPHGG